MYYYIIIPINIINNSISNSSKLLNLLLYANSAFIILYVDSVTALSYGHPLLLYDLSILNVFNNSSIILFLNSF